VDALVLRGHRHLLHRLAIHHSVSVSEKHIIASLTPESLRSSVSLQRFNWSALVEFLSVKALALLIQTGNTIGHVFFYELLGWRNGQKSLGERSWYFV